MWCLFAHCLIFRWKQSKTWRRGRTPILRIRFMSLISGSKTLSVCVLCEVVFEYRYMKREEYVTRCGNKEGIAVNYKEGDDTWQEMKWYDGINRQCSFCKNIKNMLTWPSWSVKLPLMMYNYFNIILNWLFNEMSNQAAHRARSITRGPFTQFWLIHKVRNKFNSQKSSLNIQVWWDNCSQTVNGRITLFLFMCNILY